MKALTAALWMTCMATLSLGCHARGRLSQPETAGTLVVDLCSEDRHYILLGNKRAVDLNASSEHALVAMAQHAQSVGLKRVSIRSECKLPDSQVCVYARPFLDAGIDVSSLWLPAAMGDGTTLTTLATRCP